MPLSIPASIILNLFVTSMLSLILKLLKLKLGLSSVLGLTILIQIYMASLFSKSNLSHLQRVHCAAARIVLLYIFINNTTARGSLHWLSYQFIIGYSISQPRQHTRFSTQINCYIFHLYCFFIVHLVFYGRLIVFFTDVRTASVIGSRIFRSATTEIWNSLPVEICSATSCHSLRSNWKPLFSLDFRYQLRDIYLYAHAKSHCDRPVQRAVLILQ